MTEQIVVSRDIAAPPEVLFNLISDLPNMGKWSPENTGGRWAKGATGPALGASFVGENRNGKKSWKTSCKVVSCDSPTSFAFDVTVGPIKVANWAYSIATSGTGCTVTETWTDQRAWLAKKLGGPASGVADRAAHNRAGMEETLRRLAEHIEASEA
jgi:uncharacterized protein YndB with AHSA1/START domain